jgi:N-acetylglutamate synthase-like GNAT family acetyltransferase
MIEIVPFHEKYQAALTELILPIQQAEFGIPITLEAQPDLLDITGFYQRGSGQFWLAVADDAVIGSVALLDMGHGQAALRKMFVAKPFRGAQHGVAQQLLDTLYEWSRKHGVHTVFLGTTAQFLAAQRFYEKQGFQVIDRDDLPATFPIMSVDSRFYYRSIVAPQNQSTPAFSACRE